MISTRRLSSVLLVGSLAFGVPQLARAVDASPPVTVTIPQDALDAAIKDYLTRNPEAVTEALAAAQIKQETKKREAAQAAISTKEGEIYAGGSPVAGNPNGTETLVEFFDYSCHYCKQIHPDLQTLIKDDPNIKVIYKDFPILGPGSVLGAKAALAANLQGKYLQIHDAMLDLKTPLDEEAIKKIASDVGLDYTKLKADMDGPDVAKQLASNMSLADTLNVHATPTMIVNKQLVDGALPLDELKKKVQDTKG